MESILRAVGFRVRLCCRNTCKKQSPLCPLAIVLAKGQATPTHRLTRSGAAPTSDSHSTRDHAPHALQCRLHVLHSVHSHLRPRQSTHARTTSRSAVDRASVLTRGTRPRLPPTASSPRAHDRRPCFFPCSRHRKAAAHVLTPVPTSSLRQACVPTGIGSCGDAASESSAFVTRRVHLEGRGGGVSGFDAANHAPASARPVGP